MSAPLFSRVCARVIPSALATLVLVLLPAAAGAAPGYQPDASNPTISLSAQLPMGVAVDQTSQNVYVAELTTDLSSVGPGQIEQLSATGVPTANSPFGTGSQDIFTAVAVNPSTHDVYAYQTQAETPFGPRGSSKLSTFSSAGVLGSSFSPTNSTASTLASDSSGRVFFPSTKGGAVQIFSSAGTVEGTITCSGCTGGAFGEPAAVAFDSAGNLYVVDRANGGRVVKLAPSGGSFVYQSTLQSGMGAVAVAVDPSSNDVFIGDLPNGGSYHVVAYNSSGTAFDDFGQGLSSKNSNVELGIGQLAVNATTHKVYLSDPGGNKLQVFERVVSIPAPTASILAPTGVGQVAATLRASIDPEGHGLTNCHFEYTDHADFLANGYANAETANCPTLIGGTQSTTISAGVSGLTPGTDYDYRIRVTSYGGSAEAGPQTFETLPLLPPEATTLGASSITTNSAILKASVNPKGGSISSCRFEYVTEAAFQDGAFASAATKACSPTPNGNAAVTVTASVNGLAAGTSYRYRVVATSNAGTTAATDAGFATAAESCSTNPSLCPPSGGEPAPTVTPPSATLPPPAVVVPPRKQLKCRKGFRKKKVRGKLKCVKIKKHRSKH
jgi:hypothetical protein